MRCMDRGGNGVRITATPSSASIAATWAAPAALVRRPVASRTVSGSSHMASAPSNVPPPRMARRIGTPSSASRRATRRSSPARTVEAGRPRIAPSGVMNSRSATNIKLGGAAPGGSTSRTATPAVRKAAARRSCCARARAGSGGASIWTASGSASPSISAPGRCSSTARKGCHSVATPHADQIRPISARWESPRGDQPVPPYAGVSYRSSMAATPAVE